MVESVVMSENLIQLQRELQQQLPPEALLTHPAQLTPYECDGLSAHRQRPALVVLPESAEQVALVVKRCHQLQIPLVARGAGTGLSGGALPHREGVLLSLARLNRILAIDPARALARVEPGVRNLAVSEAAAAHRLYYAPDPSSQIACTIGGNIAENAGGVHCLKYGLTLHNVVALDLVLADGTQVTIGSEAPDTPGYDLLALLIGSEGMLGVVVGATLRLLPQPETVQVLLAPFDEVTAAAECVGAIIAAGTIPAGLEMMDRPAIAAAEAFVHAGYPDCAALLLCELDGSGAEVAAAVAQVSAIMRQQGATEVRIAATPAERALFWKGRKAAFPAVGRLAPDYYCMDGTIPRRHLATVLQRISELSAHYGLAVANVFHAGDGNLHPLILYDANRAGELAQAEQFGAAILQLCVEYGGTITGEHGVGSEKIDQMCIQFQDQALSQFHAIKAAFDPHAILNPGKAVPTLHRCAELGAMHVHRGELPFPELERF